MRTLLRSPLFCRLASCWCVASGLIAMSGGCAAFGKRKATQEQVALGRQMCRQGIDALECGELASAQQFLQKAADADPNYGDARRHLAEALWLGGQRAEAVEHAEIACRAEPLDAHGAVRAGEMRLAENDSVRAAQWATQAIAADQRLAAAWALRGRAHREAGEYRRAIADLQQALRYAPDDQQLLYDLAAIHRSAGDGQRALATLHHLLEAHAPGEEPVEALAMAGATYLELGRPHDSADALRAAVERGSPSAELLCQLGEAEAACGRPSVAVANAQQALAVDGGHAPARALLARLAAGQPVGTVR